MAIQKMKQQDNEVIEIKLLLEAIQLTYGYDFQQYAPASLHRRLSSMLEKLKLSNYSELQAILLHNPNMFNQFFLHMSITVTEMFRDPHFYNAFQKYLIPILKTYPYFKIWHAGCATGEEVYSIAIILYEADLLERATIYATDFNDIALKQAKSGIYNKELIEKYKDNYEATGGKQNFNDYYHEKYGAIKIRDFLKKSITFANHNLVTDKIFGEMNVILCRNVLIYFNNQLQNQVLTLFRDSLCPLGYLCLGNKESITFSTVKNDFTCVSMIDKIYRKRGK